MWAANCISYQETRNFMKAAVLERFLLFSRLIRADLSLSTSYHTQTLGNVLHYPLWSDWESNHLCYHQQTDKTQLTFPLCSLVDSYLWNSKMVEEICMVLCLTYHQTEEQPLSTTPKAPSVREGCATAVEPCLFCQKPRGHQEPRTGFGGCQTSGMQTSS